VGASSTVTFISLPVSIATVLFAVVLGTLGPLAVTALALAVALFQSAYQCVMSSALPVNSRMTPRKVCVARSHPT